MRTAENEENESENLSDENFDFADGRNAQELQLSPPETCEMDVATTRKIWDHNRLAILSIPLICSSHCQTTARNEYVQPRIKVPSARTRPNRA